MSKECLNKGIPNYLHQGERKEDQIFDADELLFRRFKVTPPKELWLTDNSVSANVFKLENDSYNRGKYSNAPNDVLYNKDASSPEDHFFSWGILSLLCEKVEQTPFPVDIENFTWTLTFKVVHKPETCIYLHSEIHSYKDGEVIKELPGRSCRAAVRRALIKLCTIIKELDT